MTPFDAVRDGWLAFGLVALAYAVRKVLDARSDVASQRATAEDGAALYSTRWSQRSALLSASVAMMKMIAPLAAIINVLQPHQPSLFGLVALVALALDTVLFTILERDDVHSRTKLTQIIRIERAIEKEKP